MVEASNAHINYKLNKLQDDLQALEEFINGNGHTGAKTRLTMLEASVKRIEETLKGLTQAAWGLAATIIGAGAVWILFGLIPRIVAMLGGG